MTAKELEDLQEQDGLLIYVKPSLNGTEPLDVLHFARESPPFPHEATEHVMFSESQFESYRALGSHIVDRFFPGGPGGPGGGRHVPALLQRFIDSFFPGGPGGARDVPALLQRFADHLMAQASADRRREPRHGTDSTGSPADGRGGAAGPGGPGGESHLAAAAPPPGGNGTGEMPAA